MATAVLYGIVGVIVVVCLAFAFRHVFWPAKEGFQSPSCSIAGPVQKPRVFAFTSATPPPDVSNVNLSAYPLVSARTTAENFFRIPASAYKGYDRLAYALVGGGSTNSNGALMKSFGSDHIAYSYVQPTSISDLPQTVGANDIMVGESDVYVHIGKANLEGPSGIVINDATTVSTAGLLPAISVGGGTGNYSGTPGKNGYAILIFYNSMYLPITFQQSSESSITQTSASISIPYATEKSITSTVVEFRRLGYIDWQTRTLPVGSSNTIETTLSGLSAGTTYEYRTVATIDGTTFTSKIQTFRTVDTMSWGTPTFAFPTSTSAQITFPITSTAAGTSSFASPRISYKLSTATSFTTTLTSGTITAKSSGGFEYTVTLSGLATGKTYNVRAITTLGGTDVTSSDASFTTQHVVSFGTPTFTPSVSDAKSGTYNMTFTSSAATLPTVELTYTNTITGAQKVTLNSVNSSSGSSPTYTYVFEQSLANLVTNTDYTATLRISFGTYAYTSDTYTFRRSQNYFTVGDPSKTQTTAQLNVSYNDRSYNNMATSDTILEIAYRKTSTVSDTRVTNLALTGLDANTNYEYRPILKNKSGVVLTDVVSEGTSVGWSTFTTLTHTLTYDSFSAINVRQTTADISGVIRTSRTLTATQVKLWYKTSSATGYTQATGTPTLTTISSALDNNQYRVGFQLTGLSMVTGYVGYIQVDGASQSQTFNWTTLNHSVTFQTPTVSSLTQTSASLSFPFTSTTTITSAVLQLRKKSEGDSAFQNMSGQFTGSMTGYTFTTSLANLIDNTEYAYRLQVVLAGITQTSNTFNFKTNAYSVSTFIPMRSDGTSGYVSNITTTGATFTLLFQTSAPNPTVNFTCGSIRQTGTINSGITFNSSTTRYTYTTTLTSLSAETEYTYSFTVNAGTTTQTVGNLTFSTLSYFNVSLSNVTPTSASISVTYNTNSYNNTASANVTTGFQYRAQGTPTWQTSFVPSISGLIPLTKYDYKAIMDVFASSAKTGTPTRVEGITLTFDTPGRSITWQTSGATPTQTTANVTFTFLSNTTVTLNDILVGYKKTNDPAYTFVSPTTLTGTGTYTVTANLINLTHSTDYVCILEVFGPTGFTSSGSLTFTTDQPVPLSSITPTYSILSIQQTSNGMFRYEMKCITSAAILNSDRIRIRAVRQVTPTIDLSGTDIALTQTITGGSKLLFTLIDMGQLGLGSPPNIQLFITRSPNSEVAVGSPYNFTIPLTMALMRGNLSASASVSVISLTPTSVTLGMQNMSFYSNVRFKFLSIFPNVTITATNVTTDGVTNFPLRASITFLASSQSVQFNFSVTALLTMSGSSGDITTNTTFFTTLPAITEPFTNPPKDHGSQLSIQQNQQTQPQNPEPLFKFGGSLLDVFGISWS